LGKEDIRGVEAVAIKELIALLHGSGKKRMRT